MVVSSGALNLGYSDSDINSLIRALRDNPTRSATPTRHFSQSEDYFIRLDRPFTVESFPVHHDLGQKKPHHKLTAAVQSLASQLADRVPGLLTGLTHLFDPSSNHRPLFFRLYEIEGTQFIYVARIDLTFRPTHGVTLERTTNQLTARYETRDLFIESDLFPLQAVETKRNRITGMTLEQSVSDTWIGETGRGYMRAGMWLDRDLTKFFSRLLTPVGLQTYPYYPFSCKYRSIAHGTTALDEEDRRKAVQIAAKGRAFLLPHVREIEEALRSVELNEFSEELPEYKRLRRAAADLLGENWGTFELRSYLNEHDEREFELIHGIT